MVEPQAFGGADAGASRGWSSPDRSGSAAASSSAASASASDGCVLLSSPSGDDWLGREHRQLERYQVQASRPIPLRLLDGSGQPRSPWFLADILDISRGGLCLLVSGPLQLPMDQRLQMDLRCHPDFGVVRLECLVRWCRCSASFTTLGVAFQETLAQVPRLEVERRSARRDPNSEPWAQE